MIDWNAEGVRKQEALDELFKFIGELASVARGVRCFIAGSGSFQDLKATAEISGMIFDKRLRSIHSVLPLEGQKPLHHIFDQSLYCMQRISREMEVADMLVLQTIFDDLMYYVSNLAFAIMKEGFVSNE